LDRAAVECVAQFPERGALREAIDDQQVRARETRGVELLLPRGIRAERGDMVAGTQPFGAHERLARRCGGHDHVRGTAHGLRRLHGGGVIAIGAHLRDIGVEPRAVGAPRHDARERAHRPQATHLVSRLQPGPEEADGGEGRRREHVGGDRAGSAGAHVGQEPVIEEDGGRHPRRGVEHGHQSGAAWQAERGVVVEAARDLHRDVRHAVDERRLHVELAAPGRHVEVDHRRHVRTPLAISAKRLAHGVHCDLRRDRRPQRRFFND
jgi:hypothetical protein